MEEAHHETFDHGHPSDFDWATHDVYPVHGDVDHHRDTYSAHHGDVATRHDEYSYHFLQ